MPCSAPQNDVQVNRVHTGAICKEMGERLSIALGPQSIELPPRLLALIEQLAKVGPHENFRFRPDLNFLVEGSTDGPPLDLCSRDLHRLIFAGDCRGTA